MGSPRAEVGRCFTRNDRTVWRGSFGPEIGATSHNWEMPSLPINWRRQPVFHPATHRPGHHGSSGKDRFASCRWLERQAPKFRASIRILMAQKVVKVFIVRIQRSGGERAFAAISPSDDRDPFSCSICESRWSSHARQSRVMIDRPSCSTATILPLRRGRR